MTFRISSSTNVNSVSINSPNWWTLNSITIDVTKTGYTFLGISAVPAYSDISGSSSDQQLKGFVKLVVATDSSYGSSSKTYENMEIEINNNHINFYALATNHSTPARGSWDLHYGGTFKLQPIRGLYVKN